MKYILPILFLAVAATSCSVYKTTQTPDDVYFSPTSGEDEAYVVVDQQKPGRYQYTDPNEDMLLRMKVRNYSRWSALDDYYSFSAGMYPPYWYTSYNGYHPYAYNPWAYSYYFNNYWSWNTYYNPYCYTGVIVSPVKNPVVYNNTVRHFSLNSYTNTAYNNSNTVRRGKTVGTTTSDNSLGSSLRQVFSSDSRYNNTNRSSNNNSYYTTSSSSSSRYTPSDNSSSRPVRTYTPPSNSSSSSSSSGSRSSTSSGSSSSGSSSGGVSRPTRGGGR